MPRANAEWKRARGRVPVLTPRQRTILDLLVAGATNQQVADRFMVTLNQAKSEVNEILSRLEIATRDDLVGFWEWQREQRRIPVPVLLGGGVFLALVTVLGIAGVAMKGSDERSFAAEFPAATETLPTPTPTVAPSLAALGLAPEEVPLPAVGTEGRLAFINPAGELLVKPMPAGAAVVVRKGGGHRAPAWSRSGKYLAFIEGGHLVVSDERGRLTPLTQPGIDAAWAWSPAEDLFAYFSPDGMLIYDAPTNISTVIRGAGAPYAERPGGIFWSPAGTKILYGVYAGYTSPGRLDITELRTYDAVTGNDTLLLEESIPAKGGTSPLGWSGDGRWVFYREPPAYGGSAWVGSVDVHVMPAAGGSSKTLGRVDSSPEHVSVPVGPDVFAYVSGGFRFATDGGRRLMVVSNGVEQAPPGSPPGTVSAVAVSPSAARIAAIAMPEPPPITGSSGPAEMLEQLKGEKLWVQTIGLPAATQLTNDSAYRDEHPVWSKDIKSILFTRIDSAGDASVWRISAGGGQPQLVQDGLGLGEHGVSGVYGWIDWTDLMDWWQP